MKINKVLLLTATFAAGTLFAADKPNLLKNGSFETLDKKGKPIQWSIPKDARIASDAVTGKQCLEANGTISTWGLPIKPGKKYVIRFHVKKDNNKWLGVRLYGVTKAGKEIRNKELSRYFTKTYPTWEKIEYLVNIPNDFKNGRLIFSTHKGLVLLDDVYVGEAPEKANDGKLVFDSATAKGDFASYWHVEGGKWKIENRKLSTDSKTDVFNIIKFKAPLGKNLRVEYTCSSDSPRDLSALLNADVKQKGLTGYVFGYGAGYNTYNYIATTKPFTILIRTMMEGFNTGVAPGQKHRICIEKREEKLYFYRDGKLELAAEDSLTGGDVPGRSFGFFAYGHSVYEDIKVYALPESKSVRRPAECKVEEKVIYDFSAKDATFSGKDSKVVIVPTWGYNQKSKAHEQVTIDDPCLKTTQAQFRIPDKNSGIVEFDLLRPGNIPVRASLLDKDGKEIFAFIIDNKGFFHAEGADGKVQLLDQIEYRRRIIYDTLAMETNKWYTFRLYYDQANKRIENIALMNFYTENSHKASYSGSLPVKQGDYISLGGRIPLKANTGSPVQFAVKADKTVLLDNVVAFGPAGTRKVNGKSILRPALKLLNSKAVLRRDPYNLKKQSLRHMEYSHNRYITPDIAKYRQGEGKASFQKWAREYNEYFMRAALNLEKIELLERQAFYQGKNSTLTALRNDYAKTEVLQEEAMRQFADAYWHSSDETLLAKNAAPALKTFKDAVIALENKIAPLNKNIKIPALPIYYNWEYKYDPEQKLWTRDGKPESFMTTVNQVPGNPSYEATEFVLDKVRAMGIQPESSIVDGIAQGATTRKPWLFDEATFNRAVNKTKTLINRHNLKPWGLTWLQFGTGQMKIKVPKWWVEENQHDKDIFFSTPYGKTGEKLTSIYKGWPTYYFMSLNFWNDKVQKYIADRHFKLGQWMAKNQELYVNNLVYLGGESTFRVENGMMPGYGPSAEKRFREILQKKYKTIAGLNKAWESDYKSFDEIKPPLPGAKPSPLRYEFYTFINQDYFDIYLGTVKRNLEKGFGRKMSIGHDFQDTCSLLDMPAFFDNMSIALFHSYQIWDRKIYPKYLRSLAEPSGTPWGCIEWGAVQGTATMFDLTEYKKHALRELGVQLMGGCVAPNSYSNFSSEGASDWQYGWAQLDHRTGFMTFNYHASFQRIFKERAIRMSEIALTSKVVRPDIAVLEVDSARQNALPDRSVYAMCRSFAMEMEKRNLNYSFLYEKFVSDGRQLINDIPVIFVPNGIVMTKVLDKKLEDYLRNGGTIIAFAPPGVYNEYGKPKADGLLAKTFPGVKWTTGNYTSWKANGKKQQYWTKKLGKGTLYLFADSMNFDGNCAEFISIFNKHNKPVITCSNLNFQYALREKDGKRYLYLLNYDMDKAQTAEIALAGKYTVTDISIPGNQIVKSEYRNGKTIFKVRLAPVEMALFALSK